MSGLDESYEKRAEPERMPLIGRVDHLEKRLAELAERFDEIAAGAGQIGKRLTRVEREVGAM